MYSDDSLPSCVNMMAACCGPLIAWMEKVSKLGDLLVTLASANGTPIQAIQDEYRFDKEQIYLLFPGPISDAIKRYEGEAPNCQTRRLQIKEHTEFAFSFLGIDPNSSPFYQDYQLVQKHVDDIIPYASADNGVLLNFPPTIDSDEPHHYNIDRIISSVPEYGASLLMAISNHQDSESTTPSPLDTPELEASIPSPLPEGYYAYDHSFNVSYAQCLSFS